MINSATAKTTPADADYIGLMDSASGNVLKKLSWADVKTGHKTYFDRVYAVYVAPVIGSGYFGGGYSGTNSSEIDGITFSTVATTNPSATLAFKKMSVDW